MTRDMEGMGAMVRINCKLIINVKIEDRLEPTDDTIRLWSEYTIHNVIEFASICDLLVANSNSVY